MDTIKEFIANLFNVSEQTAFYVFVATVVVVFLIIVLIIAGSISKKKKAKFKALEETKAKEQKVEEVKEEKKEEQPKVEEVKVEEKPVEEPKVETKPVEEEKQEPKPTKKAQPKKAKVEEVKEEVKPAKPTRVVVGKYEVFPVNDLFAYRLKASNGEIMVVSELYKTAKGAEGAIETVKKNVESGILQVHEDKHGLWQFKLFTNNKRLIVSSANYKTESRCQSASDSFKRFAINAPVVVLEEDPDSLLEFVDIKNVEVKDSGKINVEETDAGFVFNLFANNGQILCTSIEYATKLSATKAIDTVKEAIKTGKIYVTSDKNDICQFKLYSEAGRVLVTGEAYGQKSFAVSAALSFASFIEKAEFIEE